ncbi:mitochondrial carrier domain-containing protein, partial [Mariannaea sp. PMI_226]
PFYNSLPIMPPNHHKPSPPGSQSFSPLEHLTASFSDTSIQSFAGATSGVATSVVICPLEVIKIKLQGRDGLQLWTLDSISKRRSFQDRGLIGTGRAIWLEGGLIGMYQELGPTMVAYLPRGAIYFTVYHRVNQFLKERFSKQPLHVSAVTGGTCSILFTNPLWVIKTRFISQASTSAKDTPKEYKSAIDVAWKMYCREGITSFYSGLTPALLGVTHLAVQFPLYDQFKRYLTGTRLGNWHEDHEWLQVLGIIAASATSKACAMAATYPHEVIRTRLQTQQKICLFAPVEPARSSKALGPSFSPRYRGIISTFKTILREEGLRALYSGMGTGLIGAVPASATTMLVYEAVVRVLKKSRMQGKRKLELQEITE